MSKPNGFTLDVEEGIALDPERLLVYGPPGVGKTTWAASAPKPFIIDLDKGSKRLKVARNKKPVETWDQLLELVRYFLDHETPYETLVLDTLDRAEWLCWQKVCETGGKGGARVGSIEEVGGGYAKGYTASYEQFRRLFALLEQVWEKRRMRIIITAHAKLETVKNPSGADYHRYSLKVHEKIAGMFLEVVDAALFARLDIVVSKTFADEKRFRAGGGEARVAYTCEAPTHLAKNRYNLPPEMEFSWDRFVELVAVGYAPDLLRATIEEKLRTIADEAVTKGVRDYLARDPQSVQLLLNANARLSYRLREARRLAEQELEAAAERAAKEASSGKPPAQA